MRDSEIPQFTKPQLEELLDKTLGMAAFNISDKVKSDCRGLADKYNQQSGALALNALSVLGYAAGKDQEVFVQMIRELNKYNFPMPEGSVPKGTEFMHPGLRAKITRRGSGLTKGDIQFFESLYAQLGVKPRSG